MNQTELNIYWAQTILYYCFQINNGSYFFDTWGTECGLWGYDENNNLFIESWFLDTSPHNIQQPSINTLLSYNAEVVLMFHNNYYLIINDIVTINQQAYYFASSSTLSTLPGVRLNALCPGFRAYDTTLKRVVYYNENTGLWEQS